MTVCQAVCSEIMKRLNYLDTLKIVLTLLVVFHHAAEPYYPDSAWPYKPSNTDEMMPWIWHFLSVNAAFFMGLFFLIAGYFVRSRLVWPWQLETICEMAGLGMTLSIGGSAFTNRCYASSSVSDCCGCSASSSTRPMPSRHGAPNKPMVPTSCICLSCWRFKMPLMGYFCPASSSSSSSLPSRASSRSSSPICLDSFLVSNVSYELIKD